MRDVDALRYARTSCTDRSRPTTAFLSKGVIHDSASASWICLPGTYSTSILYGCVRISMRAKRGVALTRFFLVMLTSGL